MKIQFLKAFNGDSILLSFVDEEGTNRNVLVDGGTGRAYQYKNKKGKPEAGALQLAIQEIHKKEESIDLWLVSKIRGLTQGQGASLTRDTARFQCIYRF
jgi:hypothetical protein